MIYGSVCSGIEAATAAWHPLGWKPAFFSDNVTNIPWRGKPEAPDGHRYKALGNSMAVNVMELIGERIAMVDRL